jgi:hypothetical protein
MLGNNDQHIVGNHLEEDGIILTLCATLDDSGMISVYPNNSLRQHITVADWIIEFAKYWTIFLRKVWIIRHEHAQAFTDLSGLVCCRRSRSDAYGEIITFFIWYENGVTRRSRSIPLMDLFDPTTFYESLRRIILCWFSVRCASDTLLVVVKIRVRSGLTSVFSTPSVRA